MFKFPLGSLAIIVSCLYALPAFGEEGCLPGRDKVVVQDIEVITSVASCTDTELDWLEKVVPRTLKKFQEKAMATGAASMRAQYANLKATLALTKIEKQNRGLND